VKKEVKEIKEALTARRERKPPIKSEDLLSTGVTLLDLGLSGRLAGGIPKGSYIYFVGDPSSGKTWFSMSILAEAARNRHFDGHRFVFDNAENGALMDTVRYFGRQMTDRIEPPRGTAADPEYSETIQEFYYNVDAALDAGPCVYILDSMDALNADQDEEVFEAERHKYETGNGQVPGNMGMAKAKENSRNIKRVVRKLRKTGSILIVISQTRDKIGGTIPGQKTRSGGKAIWFFSHAVVWTTVTGDIKRTVLGKERVVGKHLRIDVQRNRLTGWDGKLDVPFYPSFGFDDLGACVDYLVDEKHWQKAEKGAKIKAPEFAFDGKPEALIRAIQDEGKEAELQKLVGSVWKEIEAACALDRKPRYE
jgi:RecA/RadA recombinase